MGVSIKKSKRNIKIDGKQSFVIFVRNIGSNIVCNNSWKYTFRKITIFGLIVCDLPMYTIDFEIVRSFRWKYTNLELKINDPRYLTLSHHKTEFIRSLTETIFCRFSIISQLVTNIDWDKFPFRVRVYSKSGLVLVPE